jgi:hypothetical protein
MLGRIMFHPANLAPGPSIPTADFGHANGGASFASVSPPTGSVNATVRPPKAAKPTNWQQVLDELHLASDRELVRLRVAIDRLLLDPERIAAIRQHLQVGQLIHYLSERQNRINSGRIVELMADRVLIQTTDQKLRWLHYASIQFNAAAARDAIAHVPGGTAFSVGDRVSFEGRDMVHHFGTVVRVNQKTATVQAGDEQLRIPYQALRRVVDL